MAGVGELVLNADGEVELAETTGEVHLATADPQTCCCAAEGACYVKPKNCLTGVDHPLFVVPCTDHYYVFALAGVFDCWYVDTDFTQYTSVPTGYSALPSPGAEFEDCETCRVEEPTSECDCSAMNYENFSDGDVMVVTWSSHNYDDEHENCDGSDGSGSAVLLFDGDVMSGTYGQFLGTGPFGHDMSVTPGNCGYSGNVDMNPEQIANFYASGTLFAANTEARYEEDGTYSAHQCFDPPPPGSDFRNVRIDVSVSVYPTGLCWDAVAEEYVAGTPDEHGCCT